MSHPSTKLDLARAREHLQAFDLKKLFVEDLGWMRYPNPSSELALKDGTVIVVDPIAQVSGVVVLEVRARGDSFPDAKVRRDAHNAVAKKHHENLLIFTDRDAKGEVSSSVWSWAKKEGTKRTPRELFYLRGQSGDLLLFKLHGMIIDISELDDDGRIPVPEVTRRLADSFDFERVIKRYYGEYKIVHEGFVDSIEGIEDPADRKWYASVLLNRLMFVYFLQQKGFVDGDRGYLWRRFRESQQRGIDLFYSEFLDLLFFEGFAKEESARSKRAKDRLGQIRYLNGGLFLHHPLEIKYKNKIKIPDRAFATILSSEDPKGLFERFTWALDDRPGGDDSTISPHVLGYIFEKYINQKAFGAYYTRPEITDFLCERTISQLVLERLEKSLKRKFGSLNDALVSMDKTIVRALLLDGSEDGTRGILCDLSILDPACGSGAFLIAAMKRLFEIHVALVEKIKYLHDPELTALDRELSKHASRAYGIKKLLITDNIYGVDIMDEAVEICRLRLFIALVSSVYDVEHLEPLPNIDFNVFSGNSLIGTLRLPDEKAVRATTFGYAGLQQLRDAGEEIADLVDRVRHPSHKEDPEFVRDAAQRQRSKWNAKLDEMLLSDFRDELAIQFEQEQPTGKPKKRELTLDDMARLRPFHWCLDFYKVMERAKGGFDIVITNPPWEVVQAQEKEFISSVVHGPMRENSRVRELLEKHGVGVITKNFLEIREWEKLRDDLLKIPEVQQRWLNFCSEIPHQIAWYKKAPQFANQKSIVDGKNMSRKTNLYALFTEQCFNLLRDGGLCGVVIPDGIYNGMGTKQLREMLFDMTEITGLFGFENRRKIFEGVDSRFKFVVLTFEKGGKTKQFPAAFMRHDVAELADFPRDGGMTVTTALVRRLSPDTLALKEISSDVELAIMEKMIAFPTLATAPALRWRLNLSQEINMTNDSHLFQETDGKGTIPLYEGGMFWQFDGNFREARYYLKQSDARAAMPKRGTKQTCDDYQLVFRAIASATNERTLISAILKKMVACNHNVAVSTSRCMGDHDYARMVYLMGVANSFVLDWFVRLEGAVYLKFSSLEGLPVPRLTDGDRGFVGIVQRAARLICTTPEYDDLAKEVGLGGHKRGATEFADRARLRAELDGIVAHLYGLTEDEFVHILGTFPLVADPIKLAAHNAYRDFERGVITS